MRILLFIFLFSFTKAICQNESFPDPYYISYSVDQGLPSSESYCVLKDSKGYIWISTDHGVLRFDGFRYRTFTTKNGLIDNVVFKMVEDPYGRIWFLSLKEQLCYYENGKILDFNGNKSITKALQNYTSPFKDLMFNDKGEIIYNIQGLITFHFDKFGKMKVTQPLNTNNYLFTIAGNKLHIQLTSEFRYRYEKRKSKIKITIKSDHNSLNYKSEYFEFDNIRNGVRGVMYNKDILFYTDNTLYCISKYGVKKIEYTNKIISLDVVGDELWIGYYGGGVIRYKKDENGKLNQIEHLFHQLSISSVVKDDQGGVWLTTLEEGVLYIPYLQVRNFTKKNGLGSDKVMAISGIGNEVFLNVNGKTFQILKNPNIHLQISDNSNLSFGKFQNRLIVCGNFNVRLPKLKDVYFFPNSNGYYAKRIFANTKGFLLIRKNIDLFNLKGFSQTLIPLSKEDHGLMRLGVNKSGEIYVSKRDGLFIFKSNRLVPVENKILFNEKIEDINYSDFHGIIICTRGSGLFIINHSNQITRLTRLNGILNDQVSFTYVDESNRLWVGSNKGLNCLIKKNGKYSVTSYTTESGLASNEVNGVYVFKNQIWVATNRGVSTFGIGNYNQKTVTNSLFLEEVIHGSRHINARSLNFPTNTKLLKFILRTVDFKTLGNSKFRYRFKNNLGWIESKDLDIIFNVPSYGNYKLEVCQSSIDGKWSYPYTLVSFSVETPFYNRWYFYLLCTVLTATIIYFIILLRVRRLTYQRLIDDKINFLEQQALAAQMSPHFIFNSLNSIQSFLLFQENEKAEKYLLKFSKLIRQNLTNSRERYVRLTEEIDMLRNYIELEKMRFKNSFDVQIEVQVEMRLMNYFIPPMLIQPYVENAIIHGLHTREKDGLLMLIFTVSDNVLTVFVEDNGVGIGRSKTTKLKQHRSYGTQITEERMRVFQNKFKKQFVVEVSDLFYDESDFPGTRVMLTIPLISADESEENSYN